MTTTQVHTVCVDAAEAVQLIAATERRILELRLTGAPAWQIDDCLSVVTRLRHTFNVWPQPTRPSDIPDALDSYWNRGA